jgi:hypothetical protein
MSTRAIHRIVQRSREALGVLEEEWLLLAKTAIVKAGVRAIELTWERHRRKWRRSARMRQVTPRPRTIHVDADGLGPPPLPSAERRAFDMGGWGVAAKDTVFEARPNFATWRKSTRSATVTFSIVRRS